MNSPSKSKNTTFKVTLEFDNHDAAHQFFAYWLDGGGDGGGNLDWNTDEWDNKGHTYMRITGTGEHERHRTFSPIKD